MWICLAITFECCHLLSYSTDLPAPDSTHLMALISTCAISYPGRSSKPTRCPAIHMGKGQMGWLISSQARNHDKIAWTLYRVGVDRGSSTVISLVIRKMENNRCHSHPFSLGLLSVLVFAQESYHKLSPLNRGCKWYDWQRRGFSLLRICFFKREIIWNLTIWLLFWPTYRHTFLKIDLGQEPPTRLEFCLYKL